MSERIFAVIGHPIGHTMSPFIHQRLFSLSGESGKYTVIDISPEELKERIKELDELCGYNITIPHKQAIIPLLDELDPKAEMYGSVNTVRNGAKRKGFTTDPDGFLKALSHASIPLKGKTVIAGCGGVARTFAYEAALAGCELTLAVRPDDVQAAVRLSDEINGKIENANINTCLISSLSDKAMDIDLLINATPVGMYPHTDSMPVDDKTLSRCKNVFDAVYNPLRTVLISKALANGSAAMGGMAMLVWQAAVAHEIWDGSVYNKEDIDQLIQDSADELKKKF